MIRCSNRIEMLDFFPSNGVYAELGVFRGTFSERIIENCEPRRIFLVDLWSDPMDWIINGAIRNVSGEEAYKHVLRLEKYDSVRIRRQTTLSFLCSLPDKTLDVVYLDADHSYESVRDELAISLPRMRAGGWISGHDYCDLFPGLVKAVDEFCNLHMLKIDILTDETPSAVVNFPGGPEKMAYNSFAIRVGHQKKCSICDGANWEIAVLLTHVCKTCSEAGNRQVDSDCT